ncbi:MAG: hypothetical protein FGM24_02025 [Candidatus Kapabacteria bacterium]|nr:hypothetical protein [Candidatus Kapabacteria bacterium]
MTIRNFIVSAALLFGAMATVSFAGGNCDEKAAKTSAKGSCCSSTAKAVKATNMDADHCATTKSTSAKSCDMTKDAASCTTKSTTATATTSFKTVKATGNEGSCCSMKGKGAKMTSADQVAPKAEQAATPEK